MWSHLDATASGIEHARVGPRSAAGMIVRAEPAGTWSLAYRLRWDLRWRARAAELALRRAGRMHALRLVHDGEGRWNDGAGRELRRLRGCTDLDVGPTPLASTLTIRRLRLAVGEEREIRIACVESPRFILRVARQRLARIDDGRYRLASLDDGSVVEIAVDDEGMVIDYPGRFRRLR